MTIAISKLTPDRLSLAVTGFATAGETNETPCMQMSGFPQAELQRSSKVNKKLRLTATCLRSSSFDMSYTSHQILCIHLSCPLRDDFGGFEFAVGYDSLVG